MRDYENEALVYAETYGIIEYTVTGSVISWVEKYPNEGEFLHSKDLATGQHASKQIALPAWKK